MKTYKLCQMLVMIRRPNHEMIEITYCLHDDYEAAIKSAFIRASYIGDCYVQFKMEESGVIGYWGKHGLCSQPYFTEKP